MLGAAFAKFLEILKTRIGGFFIFLYICFSAQKLQDMETGDTFTKYRQENKNSALLSLGIIFKVQGQK
jgi:hypothetical protein